MRHLLIWDRNDPPELIGEHPNVLHSTVTPPGVLVLDLMAIGPGTVHRVAYSHGYWGRVAEQLDDEGPLSPDADAPAEPITEHLPRPPVVPGPDALTFDQLSDRQRVQLAMTVRCMCDELRCPVVLNPPTAAERKFWQRSGHTPWLASRQPPEPEPLQRCVYRAGHNVDEMPHGWIEGGWPYGPHNHHDECPRHPENYNRPGSVRLPGEGQPTTSAGITPTPAPVSVPATAPEPAPARPDTELVRPYLKSVPADVPPLGIAVGRPPAREDQGGSWARTDTASVRELDSEPYDPKRRELWRICAVPGPGEGEQQAWCTLEPHHSGGTHEHHTPEGDRISWLRGGAYR